MPDPRQMSGVPLPASELPAGTISVRVIQGSFANNLSGVDVTFDVDGTRTVVQTDDGGRAQLTGVRMGATVIATATVGSEHLQTQPIIVAGTGVRVVLAALASETGSASAGVGAVVLGPESRIIVEFAQERLDIYYVLQVVNGTSAPVDIGGPLLIELPPEVRGPRILEGSSRQATVNGPRVTVTGPFAPGVTLVHVGFELPTGRGRAVLRQTWPVALQGLSVFGLRSGELDLASPQLTSKQYVTQQGQPLIAAQTAPASAGQQTELTITGLPYHAQWPRYVALALAGLTMGTGLWAAFWPSRRRHAA